MSRLLRNDNKVSLEEGARLIRRRQALTLSAGQRQAREVSMARLVPRDAVWERRQQVAETLYALNPDLQPWDGDPFTFHEALRRDLHRAKLAYLQADAVIELEAE